MTPQKQFQSKNKSNIVNKIEIIAKTIYIGDEICGKGVDEKEKKAKEQASSYLLKNLCDMIHSLITGDQSLGIYLSKYIPIVWESKIVDKNNQKTNINEPPYILEKNDYFTIINKLIINHKLFNEKILRERTDSISIKGYEAVVDNKISTSSRLVCGLGSASVLETSITLHHIWGVPYIPASSLKGVCREVVFWKLVEEKNLNSEKDLSNLQNKFYGDLQIDNTDILKFQILFGSKDFKGLLLFLDAYPDIQDANPFELDIMNTHYSEYYSDSKGEHPPGDWENPVPIFFLVVKPDIKFHCKVLFDKWRWDKIKQEGIFLKRNNKKYLLCFDNKKTEQDVDDLELVHIQSNLIEELVQQNTLLNDIIKKALEENGIGSKRNLGYGSFKVQN